MMGWIADNVAVAVLLFVVLFVGAVLFIGSAIALIVQLLLNHWR